MKKLDTKEQCLSLEGKVCVKQLFFQIKGIVTILLLIASTTLSAQEAFTCASGFYQVINGQLNLFNVGTNSYDPIGPNNPVYNAIGFNQEDALIYGINNESNELVQVDAAGNLVIIGAVTDLPVDFYYMGDFDAAGNLFVSSGGGKIYQIDVDATPLTALEINISSSVTTGDLMFNPTDGLIYGINANGELVQIDQATGDVTSLNISGISSTVGFGAGWSTVNGELYASDNTTGQIYYIDLATNSAIVVGFGTPTSSNDGASCSAAFAAIEGSPETCADGIDNDGDGLIDGADAESCPCQGALSANDNINLSLGVDCTADLTPDMILEGLDGCDLFLTVEITYPEGTNTYDPPVTLDGSHVGQTVTVSVSNGVGNSTWSTITVEDKTAPEIDCNCPVGNTDPECEFLCTDLDGILNGTVASGSGYVVSTDGCMTPIETATYEVIEGVECGDTRIIKTVTAADDFGSATCVQEFRLNPLEVSDVEFPDDITLECGVNSDPADLDGLIAEGSHDEDYPNIDGVDIESVTCNLGVVYSDQVIDLCAGGRKILRTWTVIDWCTGDSFDEVQIVKVIDTTAPTMTCPEDLTISTNIYTCAGSLVLPSPLDLTDNCSTASYTVTSSEGTVTNPSTNVFFLAELPLGGPYQITYTSNDGCGNEGECTFNITVVDNAPPIAVCDQFTNVALGVDGIGRIYASSFDDGSHDNCGGEVYFKVRRMDIGGCNDLNGDDSTDSGTQEWFDDYVDFCCEDIANNNIMVVFRVYDVDPGVGPVLDNLHDQDSLLSTHYNDCMVEVEVEDKLAPFIICPPDITVSCSFEFDPNDLTVFGQVVTSQDDRNDIVIDDPENSALAQPFTWGSDGFASDNCGVTITENVNTTTANCGDAEITRVFTATDDGGRTSTCVQRITITDVTPFDGNSITWPADQIADCSLGIDLDNTGEPSFESGTCDNIFVGHDDLQLPVEFPFCYKLLRTWVVIDWCQYVPNDPNSEGRWEYTQLIKISDSTAPTIVTPSDITISSEENNCTSGPVTLDLAVATDDCGTTEITNDINGGGANASGDFPYGTTTVTFTATDACGNVSTATMTVTVEDGKAPTPVCQAVASTVMSISPEVGELEVWASDFEAGSSFDNCTDYDNLILRIRKVSGPSAPQNTVVPDDTNIIFDCDELGEQWVELWVGDEAGNWDYCRTYIDVQDPTSACIELRTVAGSIKTEMTEETQDVEVDLDGSVLSPIMTNTDGQYVFSDVPMHSNYTVTPTRDNDDLNGVTTYDIVVIQKHILGVQTLTSPYKLIAADVNRTGTVTASDVLDIRKLILHIDTEFTNNTSWRFVDKSFVFIDDANPFATSFPEVISFNDLEEDEMAADFVAIKVGDVNDSATPNSLVASEDRSATSVVFTTKDHILKAGETHVVEFAIDEELVGYQLALGFDTEALDFETVAKGNESSFGFALLDEGVITTSWTAFGEQPTAIFALTFTAKKATRLSEALYLSPQYTKAEAYTDNKNKIDRSNIDLEFENDLTTSTSGIQLLQNKPNPFKNDTQIGFYLPQACTATLTIYDVSGKVLKSYKGNYTKGYNELSINKGDLPKAGVMYYQLDTPTTTATRKMILIE